MKTIDPGERVSEVLPAGSELSVSVTSGSAVVSRSFGGSVVEKQTLSASTVFGPYATDMAFSVACMSGLVVSSIGRSTGSLAPLTAAQVAAVQASALRGGPTQSASNWATVGDSLSALSFAIVAPTANHTRGSGFIAWAQALSGHRISMVDIQCQGSAWVGEGGTTVPSMAAQLENVIANGLASQVLILGGINDVLGDSTAAEIFAALESLVVRALGAGLSVWLCTVPPMGSSYSQYTVARQAQVLALNERIRQLRYLEKTNRFYVVDIFAAAVDPAAAAPTLIGTYDNLHPDNATAYRMGKMLAARIISVMPAIDSLISSNADNVGYSDASLNILDNGLFVNGSGTATGFTTLVGAGASHTPSLVAHPSGFGNYQRLAAISTATGQSSRLSSIDLKARVSTGDVLVAECEIVVGASPVELRTVRLEISATGTSQTRNAIALHISSTDVALPEGYTATLRTMPIIVDTAVQGTLTNVSANVTQSFNGEGGATLDIGRMSVRKVVIA